MNFTSKQRVDNLLENFIALDQGSQNYSLVHMRTTKDIYQSCQVFLPQLSVLLISRLILGCSKHSMHVWDVHHIHQFSSSLSFHSSLSCLWVLKLWPAKSRSIAPIKILVNLLIQLYLFFIVNIIFVPGFCVCFFFISK